MAASVLFDAPGPRTRVRHRIYSIVASAAIVAALAFAAWKLYDDGQFEYDLWEAFVTPDYVRALLVDGLVVTVTMAVFAIIGAVIFGFLFGVAKMSDHRWIRWPAWVVVEFFRAMPVLLLMIFVFFMWFISSRAGFLWIDQAGGFFAVVIALTCYNGAVLAEVVRAGVQAVPKGQAEAAYAIGMRKTQVMTIIQLPQAVKVMLPAIISQMVVALKDTSLGYAVAAPGLTKVGQQIYKELHNQVPTAIVVAILYVTLNLLLTWLATWVQRRFVGEKKIDVVKVAAGIDEDRAAR
ncbi:amino acid ABC transporter permease [Nocardioides sp. J54]|uniref:amino acid ABC transporter permease n=1 Tax=Nocardioides sp. J54 TaxID=935866 RepID=UPI0004B79C0C|nr:amino acid ABC transporter permease [Nocardioides sp. J54]